MDKDQTEMYQEMIAHWEQRASLEQYLALAMKYIDRGMYMREMIEVTGPFWVKYYQLCKELGNQELLNYMEGTVSRFCDISAGWDAEPELPFRDDDRPN